MKCQTSAEETKVMKLSEASVQRNTSALKLLSAYLSILVRSRLHWGLSLPAFIENKKVSLQKSCFPSYYDVLLMCEHVIQWTDAWCESQRVPLCFKVKWSDSVIMSLKRSRCPCFVIFPIADASNMTDEGGHFPQHPFSEAKQIAVYTGGIPTTIEFCLR